MKIISFTILGFSFFAPVLSIFFDKDNDKLESKVVSNFVQHTPFYSFEGLAKQTKIVGGAVTTKHRYPYQVALFTDDVQFCGGSLISPTWVLTAAHCFGFVTHVQIGRYDLTDESETYERIEVKREIPHPEFDFMNMDNDLMLLELNEPSSYEPIKLDDGSGFFSNGQDLTVIGWGKTSFLGGPSDILLEVEVDYVRRDQCIRRYKILNADITGNMICASRAGKDSCQGDSGGPIIIKGPNSSEDVQVGVVSWGIGCAARFLPGVYAVVAPSLDFIDSYVLDRRV